MQKPIVFTAKVVSQEYSAKETRKTVFEIEDQKQFSFTTGQFVNVILFDPDGKKVMRAYSIASSSSVVPRFELCVKIVKNGLASGYIDNLEEGEVVNFMGPFGHFGQKQTQNTLLMVATGTGIAPMKAIIDELSEKDFIRPTTLLFGVREEQYASYKEYFEGLDLQYTNFTFLLYVSRPSEQYDGKKGRVTDFLKDTDSFIDTEVLICGNPEMVKEAQKILVEEKKVEKKDICIEAY